MKVNIPELVVTLLKELRQAILIYQVCTVETVHRVGLTYFGQLSRQRSRDNQVMHWLAVSSLPAYLPSELTAKPSRLSTRF